MIKKIVFFLLLTVVLTSCASKKKIIYFQGIENDTQSLDKYEPVLQPDDQLTIIVSALDPEAAKPYNLNTYGATDAYTDRAGSPLRVQTYLIDNNGFIEFPVLGFIKLGGLTRTQAVAEIKEKLSPYLISPNINLRIINYKFSVLGEVSRPGVYSMESERVTLIEALSRAGDMTIYGNRKQVLLIREINGVQNNVFIDITKPDFIQSPYYYLDQNDVVYVQPNNVRVNSSAVGPNISVGLTTISLLVTVTALVLRYNN